jgi:hypothetical protein
MNAEACVVVLDGITYGVLPVTGSVCNGITRYFAPPGENEVLGMFRETPFPGGVPVRVSRRPNSTTFVVARVPVRERAP